jgi:type VI secretion system protein ImpG
MFREYFEREADALWAQLERLAEKTPRLRPLYTRDADARVARLVQTGAFAFATARTRLDDDAQALLRPLVAAALPETLRPRPASTILELAPAGGRTGQLQAASFVARSGGLPIPFQVVWPVSIGPFAIEDVRVDRLRADAQVLRFTLAGRMGVALGASLPDTVRLFVHLEPRALALDLVHALRSARDPAVARGVDADGGVVFEGALPEGSVAWVQVDTEEPPLVTGPADRFRSGALLRNLFAFPESFCFVDVRLSAARRRGLTRLEVTLPLGFVVNGAAHLSGDHLRLFCAPATNQYVAPLEPLRTRPEEARWPLAVAQRTHAEILHVLSLYTQSARDSRSRIALRSWEAPEAPHAFEADDVFYLLEHAHAVGDARTQLYVSFATLERFDAPPPHPIVEGDVLASDGARADALGLGEVGSAREGATNITRVTRSGRAPSGKNEAWRLSAYARMPPARLARRDSLEAFLALHEGAEAQESHHRIARPRIARAEHVREHQLVDGVLCWGDAFAIDVHRAESREGEAWLIGALVHRALAERNERLRFSRLTLTRDGRAFADYPARPGERMPFPLG